MTIGNLKTVIHLVKNVESFNGVDSRLKCIVDAHGNYEITSDPLKYLQAFSSKDCVYDILYENCRLFDRRFGYGSEEYLYLIGEWCKCIMKMVDIGIPQNCMKLAMLERVESICFVAKHRCNHIPREMESFLLFINKINRECCCSRKNRGMSDKEFNKDFDLFQDEYRSKVTHANAILEPTKMLFREDNLTRPISSQRIANGYSRYSRHAQDSRRDEKLIKTKVSFFKDFKLFCINVCGGLEMNVLKLIGELSELLSKHFWNSNFNFDELLFSMKNIGVEDVLYTDSKESGVYEGILIECGDFYLLDLIHNIMKTDVNSVIVNTVGYGTVLSKNENVKVSETVLNPLHERNCDDEFDAVCAQLQLLNIQVIFFRGDLDVPRKSRLEQLGIVCLNVQKFESLVNVSKYLNCEMVFQFNSITPTSIVKVKLHVLNYVEMFDTKTPQRDNPSKFYLNIQGIDKDGERFYSFLLANRTRDLCNIFREKFIKSLSRLHGIIHSEQVLYNDQQYEDIIEFLTQSNEIKLTYEIPVWETSEVMLYHPHIAKEISEVFRSYMCLKTKASNFVMEWSFFTTLWKESLKLSLFLLSSYTIECST